MAPVRGQEITSGVYRFGTDRINWYVIVDGTKLTIIDTGLPTHWQQLVDGVHALGHRFSDIEAILLTHGSIRKLAPCGDIVLLPGHGEPWRGDVAEKMGEKA